MNKDRNRNKIYVYTTETYMAKGWYKIGETTQGVEERVHQQDGTSSAERLIVVDSWDSPNISDKDFHAFLEENGCPRTRQDRDREWYEVADGIDRIRELYNKMSLGIERPNSYKMRPEQQEGCDKAVSFFRNGGQDFLFAAVMRYGKCFASLELCRNLGYKRILLLTHKPQVTDSWIEDTCKHVNYDGWQALQARDPATQEDVATNPKTVIVYESFQELTNASGKKKVEWIFGQEWDLVIIDEEHYGTKTSKSQSILNRFPNTQRYLYLSGTPFTSLASGKFDDGSTYRWTYTEEATVRLAEEVGNWAIDTHRDLPRLHLFGIDLGSKLIDKFEGKGFVGDDAFNIKKVFAVDPDGEFLYPSAVKGLLDALSEQAGPNETCLSPYTMDSLGSDKLSLLAHSFWYLPKDIKAIAALERELNKHDFFSDYRIINASGGNVKDIKRAKLLIEQSKRTITLSCGRFNTGVSVPQWGAIFMFDGGESPADYFQTIFRGKTPWAIKKDKLTGKVTKRKEDTLVYDFDPHRQLTVTYDYCVGTKSDSETIEEAVKNFFKVANIIQYGEFKTIKVDATRLLEAAAARGRGLGAFGSARAVNPLTITEDLAQVFGKLSKAAARALVDQIGDTELQKGKISTITSQNKKAKNQEKGDSQKKIEELQQKLQQAVSRIPAYLLIDYDKQINSCSDLVLTGDQKLFKSVTGYTLKNFEDALSVGCIRKDWIDSSIVDMNLRIDKLSLEDFLAGNNSIFNLLGAFERDGKAETPGTPGWLAIEMLDQMSYGFCDPAKTIRTPACSTGTFPLEAFRRLYIGLREAIADPAERIRHILTNQLWADEENTVPYLMTRAAFSILLGSRFDIDEMNLSCYNALEEESNMKHDVVIMNPPFQAPQQSSGKRGGGDGLWNKFVEKAFTEWTKDDGIVCAVHPAGWRKPESDRSKYKGLFELMAHEHHMLYLEIHDSAEGQETFNAGTRYDWYVCKKNESGMTEVVDEKGESSILDLKQHKWLPNRLIIKTKSLVGPGGKVLFSASAYESRKAHTSEEQTEVFKYPLVHSTPKSGNRFLYSSRNDKGHFGVSKVIFGEAGINDVIIDLEGDYGMTQGAMAIPVKDLQEATAAKEFLMHPEFKQILEACSWSNFRVDWRLFTYFKEGFWRD